MLNLSLEPYEELENEFFESLEIELKKDEYSEKDETLHAFLEGYVKSTFDLDNLRDFFLAPADELLEFRKNKKKETNKKVLKLIDVFNNFSKIGIGDGDNVISGHRFLSLFGNIYCPYCNINSLNVSLEKEGVRNAQIDHFIPKKEFPYVAMSLYNFIPSCGNCNLRKPRKSELPANPISGENYDADSVFFIDMKGGELCFGLDVYNKIKLNNDKLKFKALYENMHEDFKRLRKQYNRYSRAQLEKELKKGENTLDEILDVVFEATPNKNQYHKFRIGKCKSEIIKEAYRIDDWDDLES